MGIIIVGASTFYFTSNISQEKPESFTEPSISEKYTTTKISSSNLTSHGLIKFNSADEVKQYLVESQIRSGYGQGGIRTDGMMVRFDAVASEPKPSPAAIPAPFGISESETPKSTSPNKSVDPKDEYNKTVTEAKIAYDKIRTDPNSTQKQKDNAKALFEKKKTEAQVKLDKALGK